VVDAAAEKKRLRFISFHFVSFPKPFPFRLSRACLGIMIRVFESELGLLSRREQGRPEIVSILPWAARRVADDQVACVTHHYII
jgi:hypothetical protein